MLETAQQAAATGDLLTVDELLRSAARIQEAELGPLHPDLANTLNNLAIVAEKTNQLDDAETFYRRAVAIASAALPPDHPMIAASRENLEDFCRAHGLPVSAPTLPTGSSQDAESALNAFLPEAPSPIDTPRRAPAAEAALATHATAPSFDSPPRDSRTSTSSAPRSRPAHGAAPRWFAWAAVGVGVVVVAAATFLVRRPDRPIETSVPAPMADAATMVPAEPAPPPPAEGLAASGSAESAPLSTPRPDDRPVATGGPPPPPRSGGGVTLATVQLCRTFSTSGANWRCDPASDSVAPGRLVLYTRVRSPRDGAVVHRWYRGEALQQSVKLTTRANASDGYRTYSRQTVDGRGDWRVEVRSAEGRLLHERRFSVR